MKCTEAIIAEHAALLERFAEVERVLPQLKSRAEIGAMAALVEGVLGGHADWETDVAFAPSDRALRLMDRFARVAQAHQEINQSLHRARRALADAWKEKPARIRSERKPYGSPAF